MEAEKYFEALKIGNSETLEELVVNAGYTEKINPLHSQFMQVAVMDILNLVEPCNKQERESIVAYDSMKARKFEGFHPLYSLIKRAYKYFFPLGFILSEYSNKVDTPRADWNSKYLSKFTRIKKTNDKIEFVDCWQRISRNSQNETEDGELVIINGVFDSGNYSYLKMQSNQDLLALHLSKLREAYPPISGRELAVGPNIEWATIKMLGIPIFLASYLALEHFDIHGYTSFHIISAIDSAIVAGYFEYKLHKSIYQKIGKGFFQDEDALLGKNAVRKLTNEASKIK